MIVTMLHQLVNPWTGAHLTMTHLDDNLLQSCHSLLDPERSKRKFYETVCRQKQMIQHVCNFWHVWRHDVDVTQWFLLRSTNGPVLALYTMNEPFWSIFEVPSQIAWQTATATNLKSFKGLFSHHIGPGKFDQGTATLWATQRIISCLGVSNQFWKISIKVDFQKDEKNEKQMIFRTTNQMISWKVQL